MEIAANDWTAVIDVERGGRIASLRVGHTEVLVGPGDHPMLWGCFLMAPFAGRIGHGRFRFPWPDGPLHTLECNLPPHAIHGVGFDRPWHRHDDGSITCDLSPRWPMRGTLRQWFEAGDDSLTTHVEAYAVEAMPFTVGWHPWFAKPCTLEFTPGRMYERSPEQLPTGRLIAPVPRPWDDCFIDPVADPVVRFDSGLAVMVSSTCDHWTIYDEQEHGLCVEPQSGPPDAVNLGQADVIAAGDTVHHSMTLSWTHDASARSARPGRYPR
ncbi:MAG: aldose 1-epimerase [Acidimicrobiia bacterium]